MSDSEIPDRRGLPGIAKVFLGGCGVVVAVIGFLMIAGRVGTAKWERYTDKLRRAGQPLSFTEIESRRPPRSDDPSVVQAFEPLILRIGEIRDQDIFNQPLFGGGRSRDMDFFQGIPRYTVAPTREFLDRHKDLLDALKALRDLPPGRFRLDYPNAPIFTLLPHTGPLRTASRVVHLDAVLNLLDGRTAEAVADAELLFQLAATLDEEPMLISRLVQMAVDAQAVRTLEKTLRVGSIEPDALRRLHDRIAAKLASGTMKWALWGERASWVETTEQVAERKISLASLTSSNEDGHGAASIPSILPDVILRANQLTGTQMHTRLIDVVDDPRRLLAEAQKLETEIPKLPHTRMLVRMLMPALARAMTLDIRIRADLNCAVAGLAAERFRLRNNRLPDSLAELVPEELPSVPEDPFVGQPLQLAKTDRGIVIYSVGDNGIDDGGSMKPDAMGRCCPDWGFRLLALEHRGIPLTDEPPPVEEE